MALHVHCFLVEFRHVFFFFFFFFFFFGGGGGGGLEGPEKVPCCRDENQQQTQHTSNINSEN